MRLITSATVVLWMACPRSVFHFIYFLIKGVLINLLMAVSAQAIVLLSKYEYPTTMELRKRSRVNSFRCLSRLQFVFKSSKANGRGK